MYKILRPLKDAYITDRVIKGDRAEGANVGAAGSLDLFKIYGLTTSGSYPNVELSRLLIKFDLGPLSDLVTAGKVDTNNSSFKATLKLFDVYGGQATPSNFTVNVAPLSRSFDEGFGRDVVFYADKDACNFLTGSDAQGAWLLSGCNLGGGIPGDVDYITASVNIDGGTNLIGTQLFEEGFEDLEVDVTTVVSATLAGLLPDEGFRIAYDSSHENDEYTYFVKRFASRTAFNEDKRPRLIVKFDDSVLDDTQAMYFDSPGTLFLYNHVGSGRTNITSGSSFTEVQGSNCLILELKTEISGGHHSLYFTGSQHTNGIYSVTGAYSASVTVPSTDSVIAQKIIQSGSVKFTPIWGSLDGTVGYHTGSVITIHPARRGSDPIDGNRFTVTVTNVKESYFTDQVALLKVHLFDVNSPYFTAVRLPIERPSEVVRDVHYQVRDDVTGIIEIPFDTTNNSTRVSSGATGMFFELDMTNLTQGRQYVIDIMIVSGGGSQVFKAASPTFQVSDLR